MPYSLKLEDERTAKACVRDVDVSWKQCVEVCNAIKGMPVPKAERYLEDVIDLKAFVPFKKYNTGVGHRKGGVPGRYPQKAARIILKVLRNAKANAVFKGLNPEKMRIIHACAYKCRTYRRIRPKGRWRPWNITTASVEIIIGE